MKIEQNISVFNADIQHHSGYLYTRTDKMSSVLANRRITDAILAMTSFQGKRVIDVGCGDGTYSLELLRAGASEVIGVDAAEKAVETANRKVSNIDGIHFEVMDIFRLKGGKRYDIAVLRGILHHIDPVQSAINNISKIADEIIVLEPNGFNPILKLIEKISPYHIRHGEKSYSPVMLDHWFEDSGCRIGQSRFIGLVPMFCPDVTAKMFKIIEPIIEKVPVFRQLFCGQYIVKIYS